MPPVAVRILHPEPGSSAGPIERWVAAARTTMAERHRVGFVAAGADDVRIVAGPPDDTPFGARLRELVRGGRPAGLVVLGSGAIPLATAGDRREFVAVAASEDRRALANNRYSADVVAIARADVALSDVPDLAGDNPLPRWLDEVAGYAVGDLRRRWRLAVDIDGPLDMILIGGVDGAGGAESAAIDAGPVTDRLDAIRRTTADPLAELLVAGRTSARTVLWLERRTASRTRALIEERGMRTRVAGQRPAASVLGALLDRDGPESLGRHLAGLADAALVDSRVLLAHRLGAEEAAWPARRGSLRLGPPAPRPRRRPVAPRVDGLGGRRAHPGPARRPHARRAWRPARRRARPAPRTRRSVMEMTPGLRRDPSPDPAAVGEDEALVSRIGDEIRRDGPMPFSRFMDLALYDPDGGYYRGPEPRPGRDGDFLTAPEAHPIFGRAVARVLDEAWRRLGEPERFVLREFGAGEGALALAILDGLRRDGSGLAKALRYDPVDIEARRIDAVESRLYESGFGDNLLLPADRGGPIAGAVLANEVLDALPVHRLRRRDGVLRELAVDLADDRFVEVEIEPTTSALAGRLAAEGIELIDGQTAEICLALDDWIADAAAGLGRGLLLLIDYGHVATDLYDPVRRRDGTLRAYLRHHVHDDPYRHVGRQDLTAHVDVTAVERAAAANGLVHLATTTQAEFLVGADTDELLRAIQADPETSLEAYLEVRSALLRLLDPAAMGRFRVMAFGRDWPAGPPLAALAFRLPSRSTLASEDPSQATSPDRT